MGQGTAPDPQAPGNRRYVEGHQLCFREATPQTQGGRDRPHRSRRSVRGAAVQPSRSTIRPVPAHSRPSRGICAGRRADHAHLAGFFTSLAAAVRAAYEPRFYFHSTPGGPILTTLFLNFCVLATFSYLISLTYRSWPTERSGPWYLLRLAALAGVGILLMQFPATVAPGVVADLRAVPFVFALLRYGPGAAVAVGVPMVLYRLSLGGAGAQVTVISMCSMLLVGSVVRRYITYDSLERLQPRRALGALITLLPNGLGLLLLPGGWVLFQQAYLPVLGLCFVGGKVLAMIIANRAQHLQGMNRWQSQALMDTLTGLPNRRQFDQDLLSLSQNDAVLLIDIDHFKRVNDTHGHAGGDLVLREVAQTLQGQLRAHDHAYRIGGEEFAVILRAVSEEHGRGVAERLRRTVASRSLAGEHITVSVGVSVMGSKSAQEVLEQVDVALYRAKQRGRNRTCVWQQGQLTLLETAQSLTGLN